MLKSSFVLISVMVMGMCLGEVRDFLGRCVSGRGSPPDHTPSHLSIEGKLASCEGADIGVRGHIRWAHPREARAPSHQTYNHTVLVYGD